MNLTHKQEAFAQAVAAGASLSDAYRTAYAADSMKAETVNVKASQLMANGKVTVRLEQLKSELSERALWTREESVRVLAEIAGGAECKPAERVAAVKELNSMHGFNAPVKTEVEHSFPRTINVIAGRA